MRETKDLKLELKAVGDDGTFEGYLSVYDIVDLGNDLVERGAFTKTIQEQKGVVPMLWHHDPKIPLGALHLSDDNYGLKVSGEMFTAESDKAREMHGMAKRYHAIGRPMGLSIGFETIKKEQKDGVRRLKELKLFEGSMTLFPMLPSAHLTGIKSVDVEEKDFLSELNRIQVWRTRDMMMSALYSALDDALYQWGESEPADAAARIQLSQESIDQFRTAYLEHLPILLDMWGVKSLPIEHKAGRRISSATRTQIEEAITKLQALLADADGTSEEEAANPKAGAAEKKTTEPDALHSWLKTFCDEWKAEVAQ